MSMKYLGETFDIHAGGEDLIFPHHENEIAQSEGATGKPFARYWLHSKFLNIENQKMSKRFGNFKTPRDLLSQGIEPMAIRYLLLSAPYRTQLNFTADGLDAAASSLTSSALIVTASLSAGGSSVWVIVVPPGTRLRLFDGELSTHGVVHRAAVFVTDVVIGSRIVEGRVDVGDLSRDHHGVDVGFRDQHAEYVLERRDL